MRKRIYINDHETLGSLARKYPGRSIRWLRDVPRVSALISDRHTTILPVCLARREHA